jgi:hypothetical protein
VPLAWGAYVWLGALFYLDVTLLALDGARLVFENVAYAHAKGPSTARRSARCASG